MKYQRREWRGRMFETLDLISWAGIISVIISAILTYLKVRTWVVPFTTVIGSILFLVGQLLLALRFKTIRQGGRSFSYITVNNVHDLYIEFIYWIIVFTIIIIGAIRLYYGRK